MEAEWLYISTPSSKLDLGRCLPDCLGRNNRGDAFTGQHFKPQKMPLLPQVPAHWMRWQLPPRTTGRSVQEASLTTIKIMEGANSGLTAHIPA